MATPAVELTVCLFFLGILVLLRMEREKMRREHPESFRNIAAGVTVMALVAIVRLADATGLLSHVPFLAEETFRQLTLVIATISGVVLLVSGMSLWLPLGRTLRLYNKLRIRRLDLLRRVVKLVGVESRLTVILEKTLGYMIEQFGFDGGAVFVRSRRSRHMVLLQTRAGTEALATALPHTSIAQIDSSDDAGGPELRIGLPDELAPPAVLLPVEIRGRVAAAFALWGTASETDDDDRVLLKLTCDILARRLQSETHRIEREFTAMTRTRRFDLRIAVSRAASFEESITALARTITETIPSDMCALTVAFDENDTQQFTLGQTGSLLTEKGLERFTGSPDGTPGTPLVINDLDRHPDHAAAAIFRRAGMKSIISIQLPNSTGSVDRFVVAAASPNAYSARDAEFVSALSDLIRALILEETNRRRSIRSARRTRVMHDFLALCSGYHRDSASIFDEAARLLRDETGAAAVRISMFENEAAFIRSRALAAAHPIDRAVPTDGHLIQALMPLHRRVRETGDSLTVGETPELRMSRGEAQQIYQSDLRFALLVPVTIAGEVRGVIALAERRRRTRFAFTAEDLALAESMASALSVAVRLHETPWGVDEKPVPETTVDPVPKRLALDRPLSEPTGNRFNWESNGLEKITTE